jgi:hypothetical protein
VTTQQRGEDLVPLFRTRNPEDAPIGSPGSEPRANDAQLRTHKLTQELLDWVIAALSAVLATPEVQATDQRRPRTALRDALKLADHLYPLTLEALDDRDDAPGDRLAQDGRESDERDPAYD